MRAAAFKWAIILTAALALGPLLGALLDRWSPAGDGSRHASVLVSDTPGLALVALALALGIAGVLGAVAASRFGTRTGLTVAGLTLLGPAFNTGELTEILRWAAAPGAFYRLAAEGLLVALACVALAALLRARGRKHDADHHHDPSDPPLAAASLLGAAVALAAAGAVAWVVAREPLKGQTIGAAFVAGIAAATLARVVAHRASPVSIVAAVLLLAPLAPLVTAFAHGDPLRALYSLALFPPGMVLPLDWAAGGLIGVPVGLAWAAGLTERKHAPQPAAPAA